MSLRWGGGWKWLVWLKKKLCKFTCHLQADWLGTLKLTGMSGGGERAAGYRTAPEQE